MKSCLFFLVLLVLLGIETHVVAGGITKRAETTGEQEQRVRDAVALADTKPDRAAALLLEAPRDWDGHELKNLENALFSTVDENAFPHQLALRDVLLRWVNGLADAKRALPAGAVNILRSQPGQIATAHNSGKLELPDMRILNPRHLAPPGMQAFAAKRRSLHDAMCRGLLRFPDTAADGFASLAGFAVTERQDLNPLIIEAIRILRERSQPEQRARLNASSRMYFIPDANEEVRVPLLSPAEFLMCAASQPDNAGRWEKEWLPIVLEAHQHDKPPATQPNPRLTFEGPEEDDAPKIRADARLWLCDPTEFDAAAVARLEAGHSLAVKHAPSFRWSHSCDMDYSPLPEVLAAWETRGLKVPLNAFMLALVKGCGGDVRIEALVRYARTAAARGQGDSLAALSRGLRDIFLGETDEKRRAALAADERGESSVERQYAYR